MSKLEQLFESEEFKQYYSENEDILEAAQDVIFEFPKSLKTYILEHLHEFVEDDAQQTYENIINFVDNATCSFINEIVLKLRGQNLD